MISAVILAAGQSLRMGKPKINLPWGDTTVLGSVIRALLAARIRDIIVVVGNIPIQGLSEDLATRIRVVNNPNHTEMLVSLQIGLGAVSPETKAVLITLGDQPQLEPQVVLALLESFQRKASLITVPSFQMRRGHPWLVSRELFPRLLELPPDATLRLFLENHANEIEYIQVETETILQDVDTLEEYEKYRPH